LTVGAFLWPVDIHAGGTAGEVTGARTAYLLRAELPFKVRPVMGDHLPRWQEPERARGSWLDHPNYDLPYAYNIASRSCGEKLT
jgi:hypothetical protein